jgi:O-antigen/teichoic acid export membrane protein
VARLALVVLFVWLGAGVLGAVAGSVAAAAVELLLCLTLLRVSPLGGGLSARRLLAGAPSLFTSAMSLRLFNRLDLFLLKTLGGSVAQAGLYGAAQSVAALPNLVGLSFTPLLMSRLTRMSRRGEGAGARALLGDALRSVVCLAPLAGAVAGGARGIARLVFGEGYAAAAAPLALLAAGAFFLLLLSVATSALTAADRPGLVLSITAPTVVLAGAGHLIFIPRAGLPGAAAVTCFVSALGAAAGLWAIYKVWGVPPPAATLCRSAIITGLAFAAARMWPASGLALLAQMAAITALAALAFVASGELSRRESAAAKAALKGWFRRPA